MRYGEGVSIPSQRRWVRYVEMWATQLDRKYTPGKVEILKVQFWGMKIGDGGDKVEVGIAGFIEGRNADSKAVGKIHIFSEDERKSENNTVICTPKSPIPTTSDVNMFLTRHRLLHSSEIVPRVPMSISHCWINTAMEKEKLKLGDKGYMDPNEVYYFSNEANFRIQKKLRK